MKIKYSYIDYFSCHCDEGGFVYGNGRSVEHGAPHYYRDTTPTENRFRASVANLYGDFIRTGEFKKNHSLGQMKDFRDMDGKFNMIEEKIIHEDPFPVRAKTEFSIRESIIYTFFFA